MTKCYLCHKKLIFVRAYNANKNSKTIDVLLKKLCGACQKTVMAKYGKKPTTEQINNLYASLNGLLSSAEVRSIREKLKLTQKQAAIICGGGPNSFSRYERGVATPIRATSNLLRLLNKYPEEAMYLRQFSFMKK